MIAGATPPEMRQLQDLLAGSLNPDGPIKAIGVPLADGPGNDSEAKSLPVIAADFSQVKTAAESDMQVHLKALEHAKQRKRQRSSCSGDTRCVLKKHSKVEDWIAK